MRVLLDECLPRRLKHHLPGHEVRTVPEEGWAGKKNGELLRLASKRFAAFVTMDQGQVDQQNIRALPIAVIVLRARSNRLDSLRPLVPLLLKALDRPRPGEFTVLPD
jgi:predicted nuclease of predicted toxin-antitoxin system